jgi:uncharacterized protein
MSQMPTYPGVYIHELPSATRTITGVSTSITAFIGSAKKGPTDKATTIHSWSEYERIFGGLYKQSNMSYGVYHYFLNGGTDAVIVRVVNKEQAKKSTFISADIPSFILESANPGSFTKDLFIYSENDTKDKKDPDPQLFNLHIHDKSANNNGNGRSGETFLNLSFNEDNSRFITTVLKEESNLVHVKEDSVIPNSRPKETRFDLSSEGADGNDLDDVDIIGDSTKKTGMHALDNVDLFNLLCIPPYKRVDIQSNEFDVSVGVYNDALKICQDRRAILIIDPPYEWKNKDDPQKPDSGIDRYGRDPNAAIFFPRIRCPDPLQEGRLRSFAPSGAVAGVIARTDSQRGFWKAPAGIEASLMGVSDLELRLTDAENGELNPLGINCLRIMPVAGRVVWGSRTMRGADRLADQWKYLPVRRTALYIEESLYRGTQWVVFEPNDDRLWGQIRLNVGTFMHDLFRKGAFQGSSPREAYLVKCDHETTTQSDINQGIVNILVGFAPLKPAEFVMLNIQQLAGQQEVQ